MSTRRLNNIHCNAISPSLLKITLKINMASLTKHMVGATLAGSNTGEGLGPHCVKSGRIFLFFFFSFSFLWSSVWYHSFSDYPSLSTLNWVGKPVSDFFLSSECIDATWHNTASSEWLRHITSLPHHRCDWQRPKKQEHVWLHYVCLYFYFVLLLASAKKEIVCPTCPKFLEQQQQPCSESVT